MTWTAVELSDALCGVEVELGVVDRQSPIQVSVAVMALAAAGDQPFRRCDHKSLPTGWTTTLGCRYIVVPCFELWIRTTRNWAAWKGWRRLRWFVLSSCESSLKCGFISCYFNNRRCILCLLDANLKAAFPADPTTIPLLCSVSCSGGALGKESVTPVDADESWHLHRTRRVA